VTDNTLQAGLPSGLLPAQGAIYQVLTDNQLAAKLSGPSISPAFQRPSADQVRGWSVSPNHQIKQIVRPSWRDCREDMVCILDIAREFLLVWIGGLVNDQSFLARVVTLAQVNFTFNEGLT
jgi:hypothetical protein